MPEKNRFPAVLQPAVVAFSCKDYGADAGPISPTLRAMGHGESHANAGGQVAVAFDSRQDPVSSEHVFGALNSSSPQAQAVCVTGDVAHTLRAEGFDASEDGTGRGQPIVSVALRGREGGGTAEIGGETAGCLRASSGGGDKPHVLAAMAVRRLTPVECERLQGFPDGWTDVPYRNKPAADGPRYKALGNSMAVPCMHWIGARIDAAVREVA